MAYALRMLDNEGYNTHSEYVILIVFDGNSRYANSLSGTLYVHWLSWSLLTE